MKYRIYNYLFYIWFLILLTLTSIPKLKSPVETKLGIDKLAHFIVYFILAYLFYKKSRDLSLKKIIQRLFLILLFVPALDEIHQIPIPGRQFSFYDIIADVLGILVVILFLQYRLRSDLPKN